MKFLAWFNRRMYESMIVRTSTFSVMAFNSISDDGRFGFSAGEMFANSNARILRFSGKLDKFNNPVFESQIVRIEFKDSRKPEFGIVRFKNCEFVIEGAEFDHPIGRCDEFEIVGDEFQNPELLSSINK